MIDSAKSSTSVWLIPVSLAVAPSAQQLSYLDSVERARANAFYFDKHRWLYVKAHAWLRSILAELTGQMPQDILIVQPENQKPFLQKTELYKEKIFFNISHTEGCIAIATSWVHEVGIDVEKMRPIKNFDQMLHGVCHPSEYDAITNLLGAERLAYFYKIWTLKEAYTKALGLGLGCSFVSFAVEFNCLDENSVAFVLDGVIPKIDISSWMNLFKFTSGNSYSEYAVACTTLGECVPITIRCVPTIGALN